MLATAMAEAQVLVVIFDLPESGVSGDLPFVRGRATLSQVFSADTPKNTGLRFAATSVGPDSAAHQLRAWDAAPAVTTENSSTFTTSCEGLLHWGLQGSSLEMVGDCRQQCCSFPKFLS